MSTSTNASTNPGLSAMRAIAATRTPEERKALSAKAAAASAEAARKRKQAMASAGEQPQERTTAAVKARVAPEQAHAWCVALVGKTGVVIWERTEAPGPQRAMRAMRKAHPDLRVVGVIRAEFAPQA